jgi:hypothetical protein
MAWKIELSLQADRELGKLDLRIGHRREIYR